MDEKLAKLTEIHKAVLYPIVRVSTEKAAGEKAAGTGVVIYSKPTPDSKDKPDDDKEYETYVVTCWHVVEEAIKFMKKWSAIAQREITAEDRALVKVEIFKYEKLSRCVGGTTYNAEIVAWDKGIDIAVLKIHAIERFKHVAKIYSRGKGDEIKLGTDVVSCGCSMGHEPFFMFGKIAAKHDIIENKEYWMTTANVIFGNSGGPNFLDGTYEYIGNTARVTVVPQFGFGVDVVTWMGFFMPIDSIYDFFDESFLQFIYDEKFTSVQCAELRKAKMEEEEKKLFIPIGPSK